MLCRGDGRRRASKYSGHAEWRFRSLRWCYGPRHSRSGGLNFHRWWRRRGREPCPPSSPQGKNSWLHAGKVGGKDLIEVSVRHIVIYLTCSVHVQQHDKLHHVVLKSCIWMILLGTGFGIPSYRDWYWWIYMDSKIYAKLRIVGSQKMWSIYWADLWRTLVMPDFGNKVGAKWTMGADPILRSPIENDSSNLGRSRVRGGPLGA